MMSRGTVAIVTGGGKGVGGGIARELCAAGARVCINYHSSERLARATLDGILAAGGEAFLYQADVSDGRQVEAMAAETAARYGGIDLLVNNAAMQPNRFIGEYDAQTFTWLWEINIGGYWRAVKACLPYLKKSACPRIVNISSVHGKRPSVFDPGYSMTKAAIRMFTREAAIELAREGITVNCIDLGSCRIEGKTGGSPMRTCSLPGEHKNPVNPLGCISQPEDVGGLVLYLASPEAGRMTGSGIRLDGGAMLI